MSCLEAQKTFKYFSTYYEKISNVYSVSVKWFLYAALLKPRLIAILFRKYYEFFKYKDTYILSLLKVGHYISTLKSTP